MHTGHKKAVLNDETEWVRLENHHTAIIDRQLFEKANEMHPKKKRSVAESRTNFTWKDVKTAGTAMCQLWAFFTKRNGASAKMLRCSNQWRSCVKSGDPTGTDGGEYPWACPSVCSVNVEKRKKVSSKRQCDYKEINTAELQKQSRQLTSEKMKLYDDYKDGRMDRDLYKQRAEKISGQLDEIKRKIEDAENSKKFLEQNELSDKIKLKDFLGIQKFDTEKLREIIKVIRVHSQDEIEIEMEF